ncbi:hypothetical protein [Nocardiopsis sp. CNS-639]|uniref:hypothetical protein n=1 Tax=Nocardiopsis sp. CNS-639 TaxID=1169153 RepID=UPI00036A97EC|nr:hypothetical protein [Nocardiopsis sp. CNS-639]
MSGAEEVSPWAVGKFGQLAPEVQRKVIQALGNAHQRSLNGHIEMELGSNHAYGLLWLIQHEELVRELKDLDGVQVFKPHGAQYQLVRIGNVVLYPWRYSDVREASPEQAMMKKLTEIRRTLLSLAPAPEYGQLTLDEDLLSEQSEAEWEQTQEEIRHLAEAASVVFIAYASNPRSGITHAVWGDAALTADGREVVWNHQEPLPLAPTSGIGWGESGLEGGGRPSPVRPLSPSGGGGGTAARRFDDAPMTTPSLAPRRPLTHVDSEKPETTTETGTDERP